MKNIFAYIVLSATLFVSCYSGNFGQWIPGRPKPAPEKPIRVEDFTPEELWKKILEGYYPDCSVEVPSGTEVTWMDTNIFRVYELPGCSLVVFPKAPCNNNFGFTAIAKQFDKSRLRHDLLNACEDDNLSKFTYDPKMPKIAIGGVYLGMIRHDVNAQLVQNALKFEDLRKAPPQKDGLFSYLDTKKATLRSTRTPELQVYLWFGNERVAYIEGFTSHQLNLAYYLPGPDSRPVLSSGKFISNLEQLKNNLPAKPPSPAPSPTPPPPSPSPPKPGPTSSPTPSRASSTPLAATPG